MFELIISIIKKLGRIRSNGVSTRVRSGMTSQLLGLGALENLSFRARSSNR